MLALTDQDGLPLSGNPFDRSWRRVIKETCSKLLPGTEGSLVSWPEGVWL